MPFPGGVASPCSSWGLAEHKDYPFTLSFDLWFLQNQGI